MKSLHFGFFILLLPHIGFSQELLRTKEGKEQLILIERKEGDTIYYYHLGTDQELRALAMDEVQSINYNYAKDSLQKYSIITKESLLVDSLARENYKNTFLLFKSNGMYIYNNVPYKKFKHLKPIFKTAEEKKLFKEIRFTDNFAAAGAVFTGVSMIGYAIDGRSLFGGCFFNPDCEGKNEGANPFGIVGVFGLFITAISSSLSSVERGNLIKLFNGENGIAHSRKSYWDFSVKGSSIGLCYNFCES